MSQSTEEIPCGEVSHAKYYLEKCWPNVKKIVEVTGIEYLTDCTVPPPINKALEDQSSFPAQRRRTELPDEKCFFIQSGVLKLYNDWEPSKSSQTLTLYQATEEKPSEKPGVPNCDGNDAISCQTGPSKLLGQMEQQPDLEDSDTSGVAIPDSQIWEPAGTGGHNSLTKQTLRVEDANIPFIQRSSATAAITVPKSFKKQGFRKFRDFENEAIIENPFQPKIPQEFLTVQTNCKMANLNLSDSAKEMPTQGSSAKSLSNSEKWYGPSQNNPVVAPAPAPCQKNAKMEDLSNNDDHNKVTPDNPAHATVSSLPNQVKEIIRSFQDVFEELQVQHNENQISDPDMLKMHQLNSEGKFLVKTVTDLTKVSIVVHRKEDLYEIERGCVSFGVGETVLESLQNAAELASRSPTM